MTSSEVPTQPLYKDKKRWPTATAPFYTVLRYRAPQSLHLGLEPPASSSSAVLGGRKRQVPPQALGGGESCLA